jgi:hypothetical protein
MSKHFKDKLGRINKLLHIALFLFLAFVIGYCCYGVYEFVQDILPIFHSTQW